VIIVGKFIMLLKHLVDSKDVGPVSISLATAFGRRYWFLLICKLALSAVAAVLYAGSTFWLPIGLEFFTLHICDKINPLGKPTTRVSRLLKDLQAQMKLRFEVTWILSAAMLLFAGLLIFVTETGKGPRKDCTEGSKKQSQEIKAVTEGPPPYKLTSHQ
jgi:hypothetical protein